VGVAEIRDELAALTELADSVVVTLARVKLSATGCRAVVAEVTAGSEDVSVTQAREALASVDDIIDGVIAAAEAGSQLLIDYGGGL